jgi:hypothetical protein
MTKMSAVARFRVSEKVPEDFLKNFAAAVPLWQLGIVELTGHNLEARGREEVNRLLEAGWHLLHIYTLKYHEDGVWRERPMAILGRSREKTQQKAFESGETQSR